ncbi:hypothetical protein C0995_001548 [Termitomyces sp. Mi166|nr:hypothetical protein C0995_001548 [Termitomyces sp. Mi166\
MYRRHVQRFWFQSAIRGFGVSRGVHGDNPIEELSYELLVLSFISIISWDTLRKRQTLNVLSFHFFKGATATSVSSAKPKDRFFERAIGLALGIALLVTFAVSVGAIIQKNHVTIGVVILNYMLLVDAIGIVVIGTYIWFFTLQERNNFHVRWAAASSDTRIKLQNQRQEDERFRKIDAKRGGRGFV